MLRTFLKGIIVFVLLSIAYFIYMGMTHEEGTLLTQVEIDASPAEVFSYISDEERSKLWISGLKSVEQTVGDGMASGAEYRMVFEYNGKQTSLHETIINYRENQQLGFIITTDFVTSYVDISLKAIDGKTMVTETNTFKGNNFIARAMTGMTKKSTKIRQQQMYDKLKEVVENGG